MIAGVLMLGAAACEPERAIGPSSAVPSDDPSAEILDGAHSSASTSEHFYFLPPTVLSETDLPAFTGVFDATVSPTVRICEGAGACQPANAVAAFDVSGGTGGERGTLRVLRKQEAYTAIWDTRTCASGPCQISPDATYRLHVYALNARGVEVELGAADIDVVGRKKHRRAIASIDLANYSPLVAGLPYVIAFRIEQGVVGEVLVQAAATPFKVGETQTLTAIVRDLHGAALTGQTLAWRSANTSVVRVDDAGVITAVGGGSATVYATADLQTGSTTVTVIPATVDAWTARAPMLAARYGFASATVSGIIYALGGSNNAATLSSVEAYDPTTNAWTARAPMSVPRYAAAAGAVGGVIYVMGGFNAGTVLSSVEAYDPATNAWRARAPMPTPRYGATAGVIGGVLYVVGGFSNGVYQASVEAYDPATDSWSTKAPMGVGRYGASAGVVNGVLYVTGGSNTTGTLASLESYDPTTNAWTAKAPMSSARAEASSGVIGGILYVAGGFTGGAFSATVDAYDPATNSWVTRAPMSTLRYFAGSGVAGGRLFVIGGEDRFNVLSSTEAYAP